MSSSQALAQSVFGNLLVSRSISVLQELVSDEGEALFPQRLNCNQFEFEYQTDLLNEPRKTSIDLFITYPTYRIAIECTFMEQHFTECSRTDLKKNHQYYETELCDGNYEYQRSRKNRCSLSEIGVAYWLYIPQIMEWSNSEKHDPCPLCRTYQLVRNLLICSIKERDRRIDVSNGHTILIYDDRNPEFSPGGKAYEEYMTIKKALINPEMLKRISWQALVNHISVNGRHSWLVVALDQKYGIR